MNRAERYRRRRERNLDLHARRGPILPSDVAGTVVLLVVASLVLPVVTTVSGLAASSTVCSDQACVVTAGVAVWLGLALPLLTFFVGVAVSVVRLFGHLRGWKTAVVTIAGIALCLPLSYGLAVIAGRL